MGKEIKNKMKKIAWVLVLVVLSFNVSFNVINCSDYVKGQIPVSYKKEI
jgi:hypothetical protein